MASRGALSPQPKRKNQAGLGCGDMVSTPAAPSFICPEALSPLLSHLTDQPQRQRGPPARLGRRKEAEATTDPPVTGPGRVKLSNACAAVKPAKPGVAHRRSLPLRGLRRAAPPGMERCKLGSGLAGAPRAQVHAPRVLQPATVCSPLSVTKPSFASQPGLKRGARVQSLRHSRPSGHHRARRLANVTRAEGMSPSVLQAGRRGTQCGVGLPPPESSTPRPLLSCSSHLSPCQLGMCWSGC